MPATAAEVARTLAAGRLPGRLLLRGLRADVPVAHATTTAGQVLIAAHRGSRSWLSLVANGSDEAAVLTIEDVPPFPDSPCLGRARVYGWTGPVGYGELRQAGLDFAEVSPLPDLLDLGDGVDLFRLEVGEVRLERPGHGVVLEADEFAAAVPDPLHPVERELLQDLRDHHAGELAALAGLPPGHGRPGRLDRRGLILSTPRLRRIEFGSPVDCPHCLGRALRLNHASHH